MSPIVGRVAHLEGDLRGTFKHWIYASGHDGSTNYQATGLPPGLAFDPTSGLITGAPTASGVYLVELNMTNDAGSVDGELVIVVPDTRWQRTYSYAQSYSFLAYGLDLFVRTSGPDIYTSADGVAWTQVWDNVSTFKQLLFDGTRFIALRQSGWLMISYDGSTWSGIHSGFFSGNSNLCAITQSPGGYLGVATDGAVLSSADAESWSEIARVEGMSFRSVVYADGLYVGVGAGGKIVSSPDGIAWTECFAGYELDLVASGLEHIVHGDGGFVAGGAGPAIYHSPDGITWSPVLFENSVSGVTELYWDGQRYWAFPGGRTLTSDDGIHWFDRLKAGGIGGAVRSIAYADGNYVIVADTNQIISPTGLDTIIVTADAYANARDGYPFSLPLQLSGAADSIGAVGLPPGLSVDPSSNSITGIPTMPGVYPVLLYAENPYGIGEPWEVQIAVYPEDGALPSLTSKVPGTGQAGGSFSRHIYFTGWPFLSPIVVTGLPAGLTYEQSRNEIAGVPESPGVFEANLQVTNLYGTVDLVLPILIGDRDWVPTAPSNLDFVDLALGHNGFVSVDGRLSGMISNQSLDGSNWTSEWIGNSTAYTIAAGNDLYVAAGSKGRILRSTDGLSWADAAAPIVWSGSFRSIAFGMGTFVLVGDNGRIYTSADGDAWTLRPSGTTSTLRAVGWLNGRFVATGANGEILSSADSEHWTAATTDTDEWILSCTFGAGKFLATGTGGALLSSDDALAWRSLPPPTTETIYGCAYGDGQFVIAGFERGTVFSSPDGSVWTPRVRHLDQPPRIGGVRFLGGRFYSMGPSQTLGANSGSWLPYMPPAADLAIVASRPIQLAVAASDAPFYFVAAGLPDGLSIDSNTGEISGQATTAGQFEVGVMAQNAVGFSLPTTFTIQVVPATGTPPELVSDRLYLTNSYDILDYQIEADGMHIDSTVDVSQFPDAVWIWDEGDGYPQVLNGHFWSRGEYRSQIVLTNAYGTSIHQIWLVSAPEDETSITGPPLPTATGIRNSAFSHQLAPDPPPLSMRIEGLPAGLQFEPATRTIVGVPADPGESTCLVVAEYPDRFEYQVLSIEIANDGSPFATTTPAPQAIDQGQGLELSVAFEGDDLTFQWSRDGVPIPGATDQMLQIDTLGYGDRGFYSLTATNGLGEHTSGMIPVVVRQNLAQWAERLGLPVDNRQPLDPFEASGLPNLIAYAFGLDPAQPFASRPTLDEDDYYTYYRVTLPKSNADYDWQIESTEDFQNWSTAGVWLRLVEDTGMSETWEAFHHTAGDAVFFRFTAISN